MLNESCSEVGERHLKILHNIWFEISLSPLNMASSSKRARVNLVSAEIMLEKIFNDENSADGMDSGEESDLDRQLENESGESRWEVNKGHGEMVAIEHVVLRCEVVRLRSPFCAWFLCISSNLIKIWL